MIDRAAMEAMLRDALQNALNTMVGNINGNWNLPRPKVEEQAANAVASLRKTEAVFVAAITASFEKEP